MERNGDGDRGSLSFKLHNAMTAALPYGNKSIPFEDLADLAARKDAQLTQRVPRPA